MGITKAIDAHLHPWALNNLPPVIEGAKLVRPDLAKDYSPAQVTKTAKENGMCNVILVNAREACEDADGEARYFCAAVRENPEILGIIAGIDLFDPKATQQQIDLWSKDELTKGLIRGVRMISIENTGFSEFSDARVQATTKLLGESDITLDLLIRSKNQEQLNAAVTFVEWANNKTIIVGDHLFKPIEIAESKPQAIWLAALKRLAACDNFFIKLSGLPGEVPEGSNINLFFPFYDAVLEILGEDKLIFGSDHPVSFKYENAVNAVASWIKSRGLQGKTAQKIFADVAQKAYRVSS